MPNTLDEFYKYLAETLVCFFESPGQLEPGERYSLYLEKQSDLELFRDALYSARVELTHDFSYKHELSSTSYESKYISFGSVDLLISSDLGATENYLTTLRNLVSAQEDVFGHKSIVILFTGKLDSLIGGSGDLTKSGFPFNYEKFSSELIGKINNDKKLLAFEKEILLENLETRKEELRLENASVFDLSSIVGILNRGNIVEDDYARLGLFPHKDLETQSVAEVRKSLAENHEFYTAIESVMNYGNLATDLEKRFNSSGTKMIAALAEDNAWQKLDFSTVYKHRAKREKVDPVEFIDIDRQRLDVGIEVWDLPQNGSKTGKRMQSIIAFNTSAKSSYIIFFSFNLPLKGDVVLLKGKGDGTKVEILKKTLKLTISGEFYNENPLELEYTDVNEATKFRFKVWAINISANFMRSFRSNYRILDSGKMSLNSLESIVFNPAGPGETGVKIFNGDEVELQEQKMLLSFDPREESDEVEFGLRVNSHVFQFTAIKKVKTPGPIFGWEVWQDKRVHSRHFNYSYDDLRGILKLSLKEVEYVVRDDFRKNLLLERQMMGQPAFAWAQSEDLSLRGIALNLSDELVSAYKDFYGALKDLSLLPSLAYLGDQLKVVAERYVEVFMNELDSITEEEPLSNHRSADLLRLGSIYDARTGEVALGPLHPLNVAYQLEAIEQLKGSILYEAIIRKLNAANLIPYLYWEDPMNAVMPLLYSFKENNHSPEWLYFSHDTHSQQFSGKEFVRRLVNRKITEFVDNFEFLFCFDKRAPIKINVFHMGDCSQVLQGIFDYYKDEVAKKINPKDLRPIDLLIDGSDQYVTMFEKMAHLYTAEDIEHAFDISLTSKLYDLDDLLNAFRSKVRFFAYGKETDVKYAHLSFYKLNNQKTTKSRRSTDQLLSGVSLCGLISDISSNSIDHHYVSGFGTRYNSAPNLLIRLAEACNAVAVVNFSTDPYRKGQSICTLLDAKLKDKLNNLYDHSQWVTFVDPHFDHSFFKGDDDIIIVHYSDQYSSASGFDAITVTRKSEQYQFLIREILANNEVLPAEGDIEKLIDLYNAVNGEWLLKLIGKKSPTIQMEKLSLASAIKAFLAIYAHPDIIWVPLSLEEILRVSSGAGLDKSSGLFSTKNLGSAKEHSDDILMVGIFELDGILQLQFMPVEVKIGDNNSGRIAHAKTQVKKTYDLLYKHLNNADSDFRQSFYRNFFAKLIVMSASKMEFYNIWPAQKWTKIHLEYRERLMSNQFEVTTLLSPYIGNYAIMAFSKGEYVRKIIHQDGFMIFNLLLSDGYGWLIKDVGELNHWVFNGVHSIEVEYLLANVLIDLNELTVSSTTIASEEAEKKKSIELARVPAIEEPMAMIPLAPISPMGEISIQFGEEINNRGKVIWNPGNTGKVMHTNTGIIGTMGTGKTQFTKSVIAQVSRSAIHNVDGKKIGILIFDYKGDYVDDAFLNTTGAKVYQLHNLPYNPLAIDLSENSMPLLPLHIASTLQETISNAFNLGNKQKAILKETIMTAYQEKGIFKNQRETWSKNAPTISDVCEIYLRDDKAAVDSLHAALSQLHDFEIFQADGSKTSSLFDLINGVTVIKLSGYSADIQNLVVAITLDAFYSQMQKNGHSKISGNFRQLTKMILVDEADNFLSKNFLSLRKILKEGREFGVGTILSTQFLNHFSTGENEYDQYILTWIIHRVNDVKIKDIDALFSISEKEQKERLVQTIKKLEKHQSLVSLGGSVPLVMEDLPFWRLGSTSGLES